MAVLQTINKQQLIVTWFSVLKKTTTFVPTALSILEIKSIIGTAPRTDKTRRKKNPV